MPKTLTLELPDDAFSALRSSPEEFGRELRLAAAIKWYEMERISQGKAAELAGLSRSAFIEALSQYGASPIQVSPPGLEEEVGQALAPSDASESSSSENASSESSSSESVSSEGASSEDASTESTSSEKIEEADE